jgi:hypothetical protein
MEKKLNLKNQNMIKYIFLLSILISCSNNEKPILIETTNNEFYSINSNDYKKIGIQDSTYINKGKNIVEVKITNKSNKKYIFFTLNDDFTNNEKDWFINIYNNKNQSAKIIDSISRNQGSPKDFNDLKNVFFIKGAKDELEYNLQKTKGFIGEEAIYTNINQFNNAQNYFILYPNQTKYIYKSIHLPKSLPYSNLMFNLINGDNYFAEICLNSNINENDIPEYLKKEIKENGYTIFSGLIKSNKVPVKMISLPE